MGCEVHACLEVVTALSKAGHQKLPPVKQLLLVQLAGR